MKHIILFTLTFIGFLFTSCKDNDPNPAPSVVYAVGTESNGTNNVAKLWINGEATVLSDGSSNQIAKSAFVSGSDVYVVGQDFMPVNGGGNTYVAKVWKNSSTGVTVLTEGKTDAQVYGIFVK